ncbi:hypothetical protein D3C81_2265930 [compost metagenome]
MLFRKLFHTFTHGGRIITVNQPGEDPLSTLGFWLDAHGAAGYDNLLDLVGFQDSVPIELKSGYP